MSGPSGTGPRSVAGMGLTELAVQVGNLRLEHPDLLAQRGELGGCLILPGHLGSVQLSPELGNLLCQLSNCGSSFRNHIRGGTDEHPFARMPHHQPICPQLGDRGPDHRHGHPVPLAQLRCGWNGRPDRQLASGDLPPEVVGDLLIRGTPNSTGHPAILAHHPSARPPLPQAAPTSATQPRNLMYKAVHSVLACCAPLGTRVDAYAPADITGEPSRVPSAAVAAGASMQQFPSTSRWPRPGKSLARARHLAHQYPCQGSPGEQAAKHTRRGRTPIRRQTHHVPSRPGTQP